jgi:cadmium resistance protein CadD (predicted permease)
VSVGAAYAATAVPAQWIRWLGVLPIALGLWLAVRLLRGQADADDGLAAEKKFEAKLHSQVLGVAAITIANGGDNLGVYIPLFAKDVSALPLYIGVFTVLTGVWCWLGYALVKNPVGAAVMARWGHILLPIVLIAIGVHIMW